MLIKEIKIYRRKRMIKIKFENNEYITYQKFGKGLYSGQALSENVFKSNENLLKIKQKLEKLDYFCNSTVDISLADIVAAENETKQFINKEI